MNNSPDPPPPASQALTPIPSHPLTTHTQTLMPSADWQLAQIEYVIRRVLSVILTLEHHKTKDRIEARFWYEPANHGWWCPTLQRFIPDADWATALERAQVKVQYKP